MSNRKYRIVLALVMLFTVVMVIINYFLGGPWVLFLGPLFYTSWLLFINYRTYGSKDQ